MHDFRQDHPDLSDQIMRGGTYSKIPLRRTLPRFVCDGYAAIGDSASMIEPLSGSGISLSVRAAGMLASALVQAKSFSKEELWVYPYAYFQKNLPFILRQEILKTAMMDMGEKNINVMFEKRILTQKELHGGKQSMQDIRNKVLGILYAPGLIPVFLQMMRRRQLAEKLLQTLPSAYDAPCIERWERAYERFTEKGNI